jgi:hypothetical protein
LPVLAGFERELAGEPFTVIGIHSPKYPNERDSKMVRDAIRRYSIRHPVVVDSGFKIWESYGINAWPTLVVLDPEGYAVGYQPGEPPADAFLGLVRGILDEHRDKGTLQDTTIPIRLDDPPSGSLSYPSKVFRDVVNDRLYITDSGHGELVQLADPGSERPKARRLKGFVHPNGLALAIETAGHAGKERRGDLLYIADTGRHTIDAVNVNTGKMTRVAGTGTRAEGQLAGGVATEVDLRSPWDLEWDFDRDLLYIAMAGAHQIWSYSPETQRLDVLAGSGREARADGPAETASFAQPSGLAFLDDRLYVADSEISAVREIADLSGEPHVRTVCGGDLFEFGDEDGAGDAVLLQHPVGIAPDPLGGLVLADTYNHKIKAVDPGSGRCLTIYGNGRPWRLPEDRDLPESASSAESLFCEPEGLAADDHFVWVADTGNHRVLRIDRATAEVSVAYGDGA